MFDMAVDYVLILTKFRDVAVALFFEEGIFMYSLLFGSLILLVAFLTTYCTNNIHLLVISETIAILLTMLAACIPRLDVRYCYALYSFASAMTIHSRVLVLLEKLGNSNAGHAISSYGSDKNLLARVASEENLKNRTSGAVSKEPSDSADKNSIPLFKQQNPFLSNLFESLWFVRPKHAIFITSPSITVDRIIHFSIVAILVDTCLYISRDLIPTHISPANREIANALIVGVWLLFAMEFMYNVWIVSLDLLGSPAPLATRHRHPLLSTSLTEFWGVRWNPIVCKLLQDSFYKPARKLGLPRVVCILSCFAGSALLHAWPQFLATPSNAGLRDCAMMGSFFLAHGALVLIERLGLQVTGLDRYFDEELLPRPASKHTTAKGQLAAEVLTAASLIAIVHMALERPFMMLERSEVGVILGIIVGAISCFVIVHIQAEKTFEDSFDAFLRVLLLKFLGWCWTLACVIITLPLFSIPVDHALRSLYPQSFVLKEFVQALSS